MTDLIPPDLKRCQAEKPNGASLFTFGGIPELIRCTEKPLFIATEKEPREDGLKGSMTLCAHCLSVFIKQMPNGYADVDHIQTDSES